MIAARFRDTLITVDTCPTLSTPAAHFNTQFVAVETVSIAIMHQPSSNHLSLSSKAVGLLCNLQAVHILQGMEISIA